jgi:hypothetical protein
MSWGRTILSPTSAALDAYDRAVAHDNGNGVRNMSDVAARSAKMANNQRKPRKCADAQTALDLRYGQIGISAVAAAARYQSGARNPGHPPVVVKLDERGAAIA